VSGLARFACKDALRGRYGSGGVFRAAACVHDHDVAGAKDLAKTLQVRFRGVAEDAPDRQTELMRLTFV